MPLLPLFSNLPFPLLLFIGSGRVRRRLYVPFETLEDDLTHGLALRGRLRLDLAP
jgi:hypothetical protein